MVGLVNKYHGGRKGKRLFAPMIKKKRSFLQTTPLDDVRAYLVYAFLHVLVSIMFKA